MLEARVAEILGRSAARHPGLVVGVHADGETGFWTRGAAPDAVFEIGSITKTFTATVLASMVEDGLVALDDPVARHLPLARLRALPTARYCVGCQTGREGGAR